MNAKLLTLLVLSSLAAVPGCTGSGPEANAPAEPAQKIVNVSVEKVAARDLAERITLPGILLPDQQAIVTAEAGGIAERIVPRKGDRVKVGEVIAEIDRRQMKVALDQIEASLRQATLAREEAVLGVARQRTIAANAARQVQQAALMLAQATATVEKAQAGLENVRGRYERIAKLHAEQLAPRSALDDLSAALRAAEADRSAAEAAVAAAREGVGVAEGGLAAASSGIDSAELAVKAAEAGIVAAEAALAQARLRYEKGLVTAPFDAFVEELFFEQGEFVKMESPVVRLVRTDPLKVAFSLPERDVPFVRAGDRVEVGISSAGASVAGRVTFVGLTADSRSNTYPAEAAVSNAGGALRAGMVADVTIVRRKAEGAVVVPVFAILVNERGEAVFVLRDGKAVRKPVRSGIREGGDVQIVEGLAPGEDLIVKGHRDLEDGEQVKVR